MRLSSIRNTVHKMHRFAVAFILASIFCNFLFLHASDEIDSAGKSNHFIDFRQVGNTNSQKKISYEDRLQVTISQHPEKNVDFRYDDLHFGVCVTYDSHSLINAAVKVTLSSAETSFYDIHLSDDGNGVDLVKGDGCYFGIQKSYCPTPGRYNVTVTVQTTDSSCAVKQDPRLHVKANGGTQNVFRCVTVIRKISRVFESAPLEVTACKKKLGGYPPHLRLNIDRDNHVANFNWTDTWDEGTVASLSLQSQDLSQWGEGWQNQVLTRYLDVLPKYTHRSFNMSILYKQMRRYRYMLLAEDGLGGSEYSNSVEI